MTDEMREYSIPYEEIIPVLTDNGFSRKLLAIYSSPSSLFPLPSLPPFFFTFPP